MYGKREQSPYLIPPTAYTKLRTGPQKYINPWPSSPSGSHLPASPPSTPSHDAHPPRLPDRSLQALQGRARAHQTSRQQKSSRCVSVSIQVGAAESLTATTEHLVSETIDTVNQAVGSPSSSRGRREGRAEAAGFAEFAANVIGRAEIPTAVLLVTLVYIYRSRPHLSVEAEEWALHRVFLGALMLASKVCTFQIATES